MNRSYSMTLWCILAAAYFFLLEENNLHAQTHEIKQETIDASGWFGGDNRPNGRRTVGVGQSVLIDQAMTIKSFAFHFASMFDFAVNPTGTGHEVTLKLNVRDRSGAILKTTGVVVPASFTSGWVVWDNLNVPASAGIKLIFTTYVVGGFDLNPYFTSHSAGQSNPYADGVRYGKDGMSDSDMENWTDWSSHSWDAAFRLTGTIGTSAAEKSETRNEKTIELAQNFPNPVRTSTTIRFSIPSREHVTLEIYNLMGRRMRTIVDRSMDEGMQQVHTSELDLPDGFYVYRIRAGKYLDAKMMVVKK